MSRWPGLAGAALLLAACQAVVVAPSATPTVMQPSVRPSVSPSAAASPTASPSESAGPTSPADARRAGWEADLRQLIDVREDVHPEPWHGIAREDFVAAVEEVIARIDELSEDQLLVEMTRLAAMPTWAGRDGHGGIYPWGEGTYGTNLYPLRLYWFSDGIFVIGALAPYQELVGLRLDAVAGHAIYDILDAVAPLVPRDNHMQLLSHSPRLVVVAEILHGLGFIDDPSAPVEMTFDDGGQPLIASVGTVPVARFESAIGGHHTHSPPSDPDGPLWLRNKETSAWWALDEASRTAYIAYNFTSGAVAPIVDEVQQRIDAGDVDRLVVDVRHNPGGNNTSYGSLYALVRDAAVELPHGAYVIFGRATFSAAGNFVTDIEQRTAAVLVGEDSGTSPNQYGDSYPTTLDHSGLVYRVGRYYVRRSDEADTRVTVEPDIAAPLSAADYFAGVDPAWEAILAER